LRKVAIFSNDHLLVYHDATFMPNIETRSNLGFIGNGDSKANLLMAIDKPGTGKEKDARDGIRMNHSTPTHPDCVSESKGKKIMKEEGSQAGLAGIAVKVSLD
jgi:hypothetical protein